MIKKQTLFLLLFGLMVELSIAQISYNSRYFEAIFDEITIVTDVVYGNAPALNSPYFNEANTSPQDLLMDVFQPVGDPLDYRPVIICAHSGGFLLGTKEAEDMRAFCDSMAHRGYVTASIEYRLGMSIISASSSIRAVYRGIQDGRAAIRFFKENANVYGIDTNNIYLLGSSAGAYICQHNFFMDTEDDRPPASFTSPDLGCLDCSGNDFQHSGKANGIIALWGALADTNLIISTDTLPVFLAHGIADQDVPFGFGYAFGNEYFPPSYGSGSVAEQLESYGNFAETYFVEGQGHEFYGTSNGNWSNEPNLYWDTIFNKVENFTYNIHKPKAGFWINQNENFVVFYDSSKMATNWYWDFGDGNFSIEQNPNHEYESAGEFLAVQFVSNDLLSWDTISIVISSFVGVDEKFEKYVEVFPNPATDNISIKNISNTVRKVDLLNINGYILSSEIIEREQIKILDVSMLKPGIYIFYDKITGTRTKWIKR